MAGQGVNMKININHNRNNLQEGREYGMGFGFLKKLSNTKYETVSPISPCKDYLNDVLYAEKTNEILPTIYGFKYDGVQNIVGRNYAYLGIKICDYKHGGWGNLERDLNAFNKNYKNVENFLQQIEEKLGIKYKSKIIKANNDHFVVKMPKFWTNTLYLLSMYTLLLRAHQKYDNTKTALQAIEENKVFNGDSYLINSCKNKLFKIIEGELPEQPFIKGSPSGKIHNNSGIVSFKF